MLTLLKCIGIHKHIFKVSFSFLVILISATMYYIRLPWPPNDKIARKKVNCQKPTQNGYCCVQHISLNSIYLEKRYNIYCTNIRHNQTNSKRKNRQNLMRQKKMHNVSWLC